MNPFLYRIAAWSSTYPYGTPNTIIATAATRRGVMAEYRRHVARFAAAGIDLKYMVINLYRDDVLVDRLIKQED